MKNAICDLFKIRHPIIQAGMVWVSGGKLAAACANEGILGLIGAGSMNPDLLAHHIEKAQGLVRPKAQIGVNLPLLYDHIEEQIDVCLKKEIKIFFTSAGSPKKFTSFLKKKGARVVHVCSSPLLAQKCEQAGVDAVVAEGFEAGGHNGRDEITTMCLIPQVVNSIKLPVIAAGGIACGKSMAASFCLGASGVQMGTRFVMTQESSAHENFKKMISQANASSTHLVMKDLVAVRLLKNHFYEQVIELESNCASADEIKKLLGKGRAKKGMLEGDMEDGELEIGQIAGGISDLPTTKKCIMNILSEFDQTIKKISLI